MTYKEFKEKGYKIRAEFSIDKFTNGQLDPEALDKPLIYEKDFTDTTLIDSSVIDKTIRCDIFDSNDKTIITDLNLDDVRQFIKDMPA